jgi:hypothetical protein
LNALTEGAQAQGGMAVEDAKALLPKCVAASQKAQPSRQRQSVYGDNGSERFSVTVMPNPANERLVVQLTSSNQGRLALTDLAGRIVSEQTINLGTRQVEMSTANLPTGLYVLVYTSKEGRSVARKVHIAH